MFRRIAISIVFGLALITAFLFAEFEARLYIASRTVRTSTEDIYPADFYKEKQAANKALQIGSDGLWYVASDYHGRYINIDNHHRRTTGQPAAARHTLYFFGASTGFDIQVDDAHTIPSRLQAQFGSVTRVENMSVAGMPLSSKLSVLQSLALRPGDVVMFYGGAIESSDLAIESENLYQREWSVQAQTTLCSHLDDYRKLALITLACTLPTPPALYDTAFVTFARIRITTRYNTLVHQAAMYTAKQGAMFVTILQPIAPESDPLWFTFDADYPGANLANRLMYPTYAQYPGTINLNGLCDGSMFDDALHMNTRGTSLVAKTIYQALTIF